MECLCVVYTVEPPRATISCRPSHKRPPSQNTKNFLSQSLILEPLITDQLPQATATTFSGVCLMVVGAGVGND